MKNESEKKKSTGNVRLMLVESEMPPNNAAEAEKITDLWHVYTSNHIHKEIFGARTKDIVKYPWKRKILKITSQETGLSVYRIWRGVPAYVKSKDTLYIDDAAKYSLIKSKNQNKVNLILSKGGRIRFYWNHFDNATRISFKLGLTSVCLGTLSIIIAFLTIA